MGTTNLSPSFSVHLRAGTLCGILAGAVQGLIESAILSIHYSGYFFGPQNVFSTQIFLFLNSIFHFDTRAFPLFILDRYLGHHLLDKMPFFYNLVTIYMLVGLIAGVGISILLWLVFRFTKKFLDPKELFLFYCSLLLCFGVFANFVVWLNARETFGTFSTAGMLINVSCLANALLLVGPVYNLGHALLSGKSRKATEFPLLEVLRRWNHRALSLTGFMVCTALVLTLWGFSQGEKSKGIFAGQINTPTADVTDGLTPREKDVNIVFISIDSLRADHLSSYGYPQKTSPNLDRLTDEGVVFSNAFSVTSWTLPAHTSMLTSLYPLSHGVVIDEESLDENRTTLAEVLKGEGYATAAFVSGPYLNSHFGLNQGFDMYDDFTAGNARFGEELQQITSPKLNQAIQTWLRENYQKKFFLFLHYFDVHYDYIPPAPYDTIFDPDYKGTINGRLFGDNPRIKPDMEPRDLRHVIALYDGEIAFTDEYIGKLLSALKELGLYDKTLIVLTADHGDEFFEHGRKGHRKSLYDEVLRVPLIIKFPLMWKAGEKRSDIVSIVDIMPTILTYLGAEPPEEVQGRNLLRLLTGEQRWDDSVVYADLMYNQVAARSKSLKLDHRLSFPKAEFYDLVKDPEEKHNLFIRGKTLNVPGGEVHFASLLDWLNTQLLVSQTLQKSEDRKNAELSKGLKDQLRALGYIQ